MKKTVKKNVKSEIISAAWKLFREKGYENTTIDKNRNLVCAL